MVCSLWKYSTFRSVAFPLTVTLFPVGGVSIDGHTVCRHRRADDVLVTRRGNVRVLIERVSPICRRAQVRPTRVPARFGAGAVADVVVGVLELLAAHRRPIRPVTLAGDQLIAVIVGVFPNRARSEEHT